MPASLMKSMLRLCRFVRQYRMSLEELRAMPLTDLLKKYPGAFLPMWAVVYFRELPAALSEVDQNLLEILFNFGNTYTEDKIFHEYEKKAKEASGPSESIMKRLGYSDSEVAGMEL